MKVINTKRRELLSKRLRGGLKTSMKQKAYLIKIGLLDKNGNPKGNDHTL